MIAIQPICAERLPDFLAFFDHEAFADNPKWAGCYCHFPHADHARVVWKERTAADNRPASAALVCSGKMQGYLAYHEGRAVGWCNAGPRALIDGLFGESDPQAAQIGSIACFVIAPARRRQGVATALLDAACTGFAEQGLTWAEAYPQKGEQSAAAHHFGALEMYLRAGFAVHRDDADGVVVRKPLRPAAASEAAKCEASR